MEKDRKNLLYIIITIASIVIVAILGSVFVNLGMDWFDSLDRPSQWIPNIVIPIVWTVIYITFAIVLSLWIKNIGLKKSTIILLIINGVLNILWCLVFFTLRLTFLGNIVIVLNLIAGFSLYFNMYAQNKTYTLFTIIYPIWLSLATSLNLALWILN